MVYLLVFPNRPPALKASEKNPKKNERMKNRTWGNGVTPADTREWPERRVWSREQARMALVWTVCVQKAEDILSVVLCV